MAAIGLNPAQINESPATPYNNDTPTTRAIESISTDALTPAASATIQKISDRMEGFIKTAALDLPLLDFSMRHALLDIRTLEAKQFSEALQFAVLPILRKATTSQTALPTSVQALTAVAIVSCAAYNLFCMKAPRTEQFTQERQATSQATAPILQNYAELPPQFVASLAKLATLLQQRSSAQTQEPFNPLDIAQIETALDAFEEDLKEILKKRGSNLTIAYTLFTSMQAAQQSLANAKERYENSKAKLLQLIQEADQLGLHPNQANTQ